MATFDGDNLIITLDAPVNGLVTLDVQRLYSEWKEWQLDNFQNVGYPPAFRTTAGDEIVTGTNSVPYFYLRNDFGWRIRPAEADHEISIEGQLAPQDATIPRFTPTIGGFTVLGIGIQPVAQTVSSGVELSAEAVSAIETAIFDHVVEAALSFDDVLRLLGAVAAGDIEQATDGSYTIRGLDGTTARILGQLATNNGRDITSVNAA